MPTLFDDHGGRVGYLFIDPQEHYRWPYSQRKIQTLIKLVCKAAGLRQRTRGNLIMLENRYAYAILMMPLLLVQAFGVRRKTPRLPEPPGDRAALESRGNQWYGIIDMHFRS